MSTRTNRPVTVAALMVSLFTAAVEATVVSTAMPRAVGELGGLRLYSWVFTSYVLTSTVTVPIYGKLVDIYGRKPIMIFGIVLFLAGSVASGFAPTMPTLIAFRSVQGLGAGAIQPIALTIIGDIFSLEERARVQGLFGSVWGVAGLVGPLAGGLIVKYLSWRWVFFVNVPFGLLAGLLLVVAYHEQPARRAPRLDFAGAGLLTCGVLALLVGTQGGLRAILAFAIAALFIWGFISVEKTAPDPVVPLPLFRTRVIATASVIGALLGATMFGALTYVPLFVQGVIGGSPTEAGRIVTPMVIGWPIASTLGGRWLVRVGFRPLVFLGLSLTAISATLLAILLHPGANPWIPLVVMFAYGAGMGFTNTTTLIAVQTTCPPEQRGVATASTMFSRSIGGALGIGLMGGVLTAALARHPEVPKGAADALLSGHPGAEIPASVVARLSAALNEGLRVNFWLIAAFGAVALACAFLFPSIPIAKGQRSATDGAGGH